MACLFLLLYSTVYSVVMEACLKSEKETLVQHFVTDPGQRLFHMSGFSTKQDVFDFISRTSIDDVVQPIKK